MDQSEVRRVEMPLQLRAAPINSIDKAKRTAVVEWTRGAGVRRYDWMRDRFYARAALARRRRDSDGAASSRDRRRSSTATTSGTCAA
jgi:hypothetical protein